MIEIKMVFLISFLFKIDIDEDNWKELFSLINYNNCTEEMKEKVSNYIEFEIEEEEDNKPINRQYTLNIPPIPVNGNNLINKTQIEKVIPNDGYINELILKEVYDVEFQYANEENIKGNKMLLSINCRKFEEIFNNNNDNNGIIVLPNYISKIGLKEIIKYLGYGKIEIISSNVIDILLSSLYFELKELLKCCSNYIKIHFNMKMMKRLLIVASEYWDYPEEIKPILNDYIKYNGYRLLNTSIYYYYYFFL